MKKRLLLITCMLIIVGACKKDGKQITPKANNPTTVQPQEIKDFFASVPQITPADTLLHSAESKIIDGKQVVRIPIGNDAALYFTKENDSLKVYAYKWNDQNPGAKTYTGQINSYDFQTHTLSRMVYSNQKLTSSVLLTRSDPSHIVVNSDPRLKVETIFADLWCWITGGSVLYGSSNGCYYAPSGDSGDDGDSGGGDDGGDDGGYIFIGVSGGSPTGAGGGSSSGGGGGAAWGPPPCPPSTSVSVQSTDPRLKINVAQPVPTPIGTNPVSSTGCPTSSGGQWQQYTVTSPAQLFLSPSVNDEDDNNNQVEGDDNTVYPVYQTTSPWPTVANVIAKSKFVLYNGQNCLTLAKQQIGQLGYTISNYGDATQTIQAYTEAGGANLANAKLAVSYLNGALQKGIPVIVGVDDAPGGNTTTDKSTNHFIVIVGSGSDAGGNFYRFYDSSTGVAADGTSDNNIIYYNATTGKISGNTQSGYDNAAMQSTHSYMHPYILTQVRKSKLSDI